MKYTWIFILFLAGCCTHPDYGNKIIKYIPQSTADTEECFIDTEYGAALDMDCIEANLKRRSIRLKDLEE